MPQTLTPEQASPQAMREYFRDIAPKYDFITGAFSFGMDRKWKEHGVRAAGLPPRAVVLDLACGTGDFSRLCEQQLPSSVTVQADLSEEMLREARRHGLWRRVCGDAQRLPFAKACFDAVMVGYGLRNFPRLKEALDEIYRVLKPGGVLVGLDFYLPESWAYRQAFLGYLWMQGAVWGLILHRRARTYTYIPDSLRRFLPAAGMARLLRESGFHQTRMQLFLGGGIALHWARKQGRECR